MTTPLEITELLQESGWLRALAASLLGRGPDADDLAQDTWLASLRRPPPSGGPRPWLARVARNLARNERRGRARRSARETFAHEERDPAGPDALAQAAEAQRRLAQAVTQLPPELRDVVVLRYFHGLDSPEVGTRLGVPASTVRNRIARALAALRAELDRGRGGREAWAALLAPLARPEGAPAALGAGAGIAWGSLVPLGALALGLSAMIAAWALQSSPGREGTETSAALAAARDAGSERSPDPHEPKRPVAQGERSEVDARPAELDERRHEPELVELSGTVLVDGRGPAYPLTLTVGFEPLVLEPEEEGRFSFRVPASWSGELQVRDYALESGEPTARRSGPWTGVALAAPRTGLLLRLTAGPEIVGRILSPEHRPLHLVGLAVVEGTRAGNRTYEEGFTLRTGVDGRFRLPYRVGTDHGSISVRVESELHGFLRQDREGIVSAQGLDLGDLVLEAPRSIAFRVTDARGVPLEGAVAWVEPMGLMRASEPTGPDGTGSLGFAPAREVDLRFSALGYEDRVVRAPLAQTLDVTLEPLAMLDLRLVGSLATEMVWLRLTSSVAVFTTDLTRDASTAGQGHFGAAKAQATGTPQDGGAWLYAYLSSSDGRYLLPGLAPGAPITLEVLGAEGRLLESRVLSLGEGEHTTRILGEPEPPR